MKFAIIATVLLSLSSLRDEYQAAVIEATTYECEDGGDISSNTQDAILDATKFWSSL